MNILVDGSSYELDNVGDTAMLQVATSRLLGMWPDAKISVFTGNEERLKLIGPTLSALPPQGRDVWFKPAYLSDRLQAHLPVKASRYLEQKEASLKERDHRLARLLMHYRMKLDSGRDSRTLTSFLSAIDSADLVLSTGGGFLNDIFERHGTRVLKTLNAAARRKIPTAMLGQGIGPVTGAKLTGILSNVLPKLSLIAVRERLHSVPLLTKMGVSKDRVFVTGDDAIEMAHALRPQHIGEGLGINLRMASYAGMTAIVTENVRDAIKTFAARNKTELVPLPIDHARDLAAIKEHFYQANDDLNGRSQDSSVGNIIAEVGRCRVIVTGSYHAAVFGLAQGIPSIGLANSDYYRNKFGGLEDMFGEGSTLIDLRAPDHVKQLSRTLDEFWQNAEAIRPGLLSASVVQIESGLAAYRELAKL